MAIIDSSEIDSSEIDSSEIDSSEIDSSEIDSSEIDSSEINSSGNRVIFNTVRLLVSNCEQLIQHEQNQNKLAENIVKLLSPAVVKSLPCGWQGIESPEQALGWLQNQLKEGDLLAVKLKEQAEIIGFIFLYEHKSKSGSTSINIGYLLGEKYWGKGFASEMLSALVNNYQNEANISANVRTLFAGVEAGNTASVKVLEKCGFKLSTPESATGDNLFYELRLHVFN